MITITTTVEEILLGDDVALAAARAGWLNLSAYARSIRQQVADTLIKDVAEATIVTALSRLTAALTAQPAVPTNVIQSLAVHTNLEGITYERTSEVSGHIRRLYREVAIDDKTFLTVTQGINEITVIAEAPVAQAFRRELAAQPVIYDKTNLLGITAKFKAGYLEIPNLIYSLGRRLAYKNINIIEIVSTATELTYILEKRYLAVALEQLQKEF